MRRQRNGAIDDADMAAGRVADTAPSTASSTNSLALSVGGFTDDSSTPSVLVLGVDVSHLSRRNQFIVTASGVFWFSLLYGYLQELISVQLCRRQLGLFLAMIQFAGYTILSWWLRNLVNRKQKAEKSSHLVPTSTYVGLSVLRAIDLGMTNVAMQYINYPAKTLMKSSRIVFTMLFGVYFGKKYGLVDYAIVGAMVVGLALFMHADAHSDAVFDYRGVLMLTVSLICDGAISNMSESIMQKYGVGQDEFIFRLYSIAFIAISIAAAAKGDLRQGMAWMMVPGVYDDSGSIEPTNWTVAAKWTVLVVFSSMGFFGSSCSAAITKNFGALTMSITSTARKATTLFLSFFLFGNICTMEHLAGIIVFITALTTKSLRRRGRKRRSPKHRTSGTAMEPVQQSQSARSSTRASPRSRGIVRRTNSSDGSPIQLSSSSNSSSHHNNMARGIHVV